MSEAILCLIVVIVIIGIGVLGLFLLAKLVEWLLDDGISDLFCKTLLKSTNSKKDWKKRQCESQPCMTFEWWKDIFLTNPDRWRIGGIYDNPKCYSDDYVHAYVVRFTSYDDWKQYRKFATEWLADEKEREDNEKAKDDLRYILECAQRDIDAYKAKIDGEMDRAVDTCREVAERIASGDKLEENVTFRKNWAPTFLEWLEHDKEDAQ